MRTTSVTTELHFATTLISANSLKDVVIPSMENLSPLDKVFVLAFKFWFECLIEQLRPRAPHVSQPTSGDSHFSETGSLPSAQSSTLVRQFHVPVKRNTIICYLMSLWS